ncbi:hypothetical protein F5880DRAFT_1617666 [Lentinula raphanica]|nr:hypothetical protein F5880DRAFT_1617666 [Lentinula raphanica]
MPRVRDEPPPPPAPAAELAPGPLPDGIVDGKKHDIDRSITDLVRKHWGDDYEAIYLESKPAAASWQAQKAEEILGLLERKEGVFSASKGARANRRKANLDALRQCLRNLGTGLILKQATGPQTLSKQGAQAIVDALLKLGSPIAGRDLYEQAHKDNIKASAKGGVTGNAAGNYQQALKHSWLQLSEEERRAWEERALEEAQDIDKNQELLLSIINFTFMSMAKSGRFGEMEFLSLLTMRSTNGTLRARAVLGGTSGKDFKETFDDWDEHYLLPFQEWAEDVLPKSREDAPVIKRDESGYPVFPNIQTLEARPKDLQVMVKTFLDLLYREQYSEQLPWEELQQKPEDFYDVLKFNLPVPLKDPSAMGFSIFPLVETLKDLDPPFRFR